MSDTLTPPDRLAKYRRPGQSPAVTSSAVPEVQADKKPYVAYHLSKEAKRHLEIRVRFPDPAECPLNSMITHIQGEWRMGLGVTILYGATQVIEIAGDNLQELFRAVQDWKAEWIEEFDPQLHLPPSDPNAPFIKSITIHNKRPEDPPPPHQRH